jgi:hypothetical protein
MRPGDAWVDIAAEPGHPASVLLPWPAILAALGPLSFLLGQALAGSAGVSLGRALGFALVYYAAILGLLVLQATLLRRLGAILGCRPGDEEAFKLAVWSAVPFFISGLSLVAPRPHLETVAVLAALLGGLADGHLLHQGLKILVQGDARARGLLSAVAAGGLLTAWVLVFFLLLQILL